MIEMNKQMVMGVSKEEPRVINEKGGSQSRTLYDFSLADPKAMFEMTRVLKEGADKYGRENWRLISIEDHINHLLIHAYAYLAGDRSDEHLSHIMCRALFAQGVAVQTDDDVQAVLDSRRKESVDEILKGFKQAGATLPKLESTFSPGPPQYSKEEMERVMNNDYLKSITMIDPNSETGKLIFNNGVPISNVSVDSLDELMKRNVEKAEQSKFFGK